MGLKLKKNSGQMRRNRCCDFFVREDFAGATCRSNLPEQEVGV